MFVDSVRGDAFDERVDGTFEREWCYVKRCEGLEVNR